jgi:hypothetical protein
MVAMAGVAALTLIGADTAGGQQTPAYVRINVSEKSTVYLEFRGAELRAATSVEGLKTAQPVLMRSVGGRPGQFPEITLPIPADQLPTGIVAIRGTFELGSVMHPVAGRMEKKTFSYGQIGICRNDEKNAQWQYNVSIQLLTGDVAESTPGIQLPTMLPDLDNVKASLETKPSRGKLAIGLRIMAGGATLTDVRKDGQPVQVKMVVADASGAEIASKIGPLSTFGFS